MDLTASRPLAYAALASGHRAAPPANSPSLSTDIPAEKAVTPSAKAETFQDAAARRNDAERFENEPIKRDDFLDPVTNSLVYKAVIENTGEIVTQIPDETILRLRRAIAETTAVNLTGIGFDKKL